MLSPDLDAWTQARLADVYRRELVHSFRVGPQKPLGSYRISRGAKDTPQAVLTLLKTKLRHPFSIQWAAFDESLPQGGEVVFPEGFTEPLPPKLTRLDRLLQRLPDPMFVYVWHEPSLARLLKANAATLVAAGWPTTPEAFVQHHHRVDAPNRTPLWDLVAAAYGDFTNPGRTDVLPHVSVQDKLDAMILAFGHPDPIAHKLTEAERPRLRVHVYREDPAASIWVAQGLELGFMARGVGCEEAIENFERALRTEIDLASDEIDGVATWLAEVHELDPKSQWMRFSNGAPRCTHRPGPRFSGALAQLPFLGLLYEVEAT